MRIEAVGNAPIPRDARIGQRWKIQGYATLTSISTDEVDITRLGGEVEYALGEHSARLILTSMELENP